MLKEAETEETRLFYRIFIIGGISILIVAFNPGSCPPGYAYGGAQHYLIEKFIVKPNSSSAVESQANCNCWKALHSNVVWL